MHLPTHLDKCFFVTASTHTPSHVHARGRVIGGPGSACVQVVLTGLSSVREGERESTGLIQPSGFKSVLKRSNTGENIYY